MMVRILLSAFAVALSASGEEQHLSLLQTAVSAHQQSAFSGKAECKAARGRKRAARKALKDLRAQLKAAKGVLATEKAAVADECPKKEKKVKTTTEAPNLLETKCHCTFSADNDIDEFYIDGVDQTSTIESTVHLDNAKNVLDGYFLSDWRKLKKIAFDCTAATKIAIKASDGGAGGQKLDNSGGCISGGFALKCVTDDQSSVWHQYRTDKAWKAKGFNCENGCLYANKLGSHKNTFIPTPPSTWYANNFDDSEWENASEGIPHTVSALSGSDISICATGGPGWLFRGGSTHCHAESLSSCTATSD